VEVHVLQTPGKAQDALLVPLMLSASASVGTRMLMLLQYAAAFTPVNCEPGVVSV
jgi:hypothetical protein